MKALKYIDWLFRIFWFTLIIINAYEQNWIFLGFASGMLLSDYIMLIIDYNIMSLKLRNLDKKLEKQELTSNLITKTFLYIKGLNIKAIHQLEIHRDIANELHYDDMELIEIKSKCYLYYNNESPIECELHVIDYHNENILQYVIVFKTDFTIDENARFEITFTEDGLNRYYEVRAFSQNSL